MDEKLFKELGYHDAAWFQQKTDSYTKRWDAAPWHENADRTLKSIANSVRSYMSIIQTFPENFLPSVLDQHLGLLSEAYEYQALDIVEYLGDDRYICSNDIGEIFCIWSKALGRSLDTGGISFLTAIIRLVDTTTKKDEWYVKNTPIPAIVYGPVFVWKSLVSSDFSQIAKEIAPDLYRLKGASAVIKQYPAPFWALWSLAEIPRVMHKTEEVCTCWFEGRFTEDPSSFLKGPWKKDSIGKRVRYIKSGSKPFFQQIIIFDVKTLQGIVLTRRASYLEKLMDILSGVFTPSTEDPFFITVTMEKVYSEILKKDLPHKKWTHAFDQADKVAEGKKSVDTPERTKKIDSINLALNELSPLINAKIVPDWNSFATKYSLDSESIESLKLIYKKYCKK